MATVTIKLVDEGEHVQILCEPSIPHLVEIAKGYPSAAQVYAMKAIRLMIADSATIEKEQAGGSALSMPGQERFRVPEGHA